MTSGGGTGILRPAFIEGADHDGVSCARRECVIFTRRILEFVLPRFRLGEDPAGYKCLEGLLRLTRKR